MQGLGCSISETNDSKIYRLPKMNNFAKVHYKILEGLKYRLWACELRNNVNLCQKKKKVYMLICKLAGVKMQKRAARLYDGQRSVMAPSLIPTNENVGKVQEN